MAASTHITLGSVALDAAGDHDGAVNELALGTQRRPALYAATGRPVAAGGSRAATAAQKVAISARHAKAGCQRQPSAPQACLHWCASSRELALAVAWLAKARRLRMGSPRDGSCSRSVTIASSRERSATAARADWRAVVSAVRLEDWRCASGRMCERGAARCARTRPSFARKSATCSSSWPAESSSWRSSTIRSRRRTSSSPLIAATPSRRSISRPPELVHARSAGSHGRGVRNFETDDGRPDGAALRAGRADRQSLRLRRSRYRRPTMRASSSATASASSRSSST